MKERKIDSSNPNVINIDASDSDAESSVAGKGILPRQRVDLGRETVMKMEPSTLLEKDGGSSAADGSSVVSVADARLEIGRLSRKRDEYEKKVEQCKKDAHDAELAKTLAMQALEVLEREVKCRVDRIALAKERVDEARGLANTAAQALLGDRDNSELQDKSTLAAGSLAFTEKLHTMAVEELELGRFKIEAILAKEDLDRAEQEIKLAEKGVRENTKLVEETEHKKMKLLRK